MLKIFSPIVQLLRLADSDLASMSKVYYYCSLMAGKIEALTLARGQKNTIAALFEARWKMLHDDYHAAGIALDPQFIKLPLNDEVQRGLMKVIKLLLPTLEEAKAAMLSYATYRAREEGFSDGFVFELAQDMPAYQWWEHHGTSTPALRKVAMRVLSMVASAGACERNWSTYDFIHSKKRNRLSSKRCESLVYVFANTRLHAKTKNA